MNRIFRIVLLIVVVGVFPVASHAAGPITVDTASDDALTNGNCTLREAITAANTDSAVDTCMAGLGTDTIIFDDDYTITLDPALGQLPAVTSGMTISGNGMTDTIVQASATPESVGYRVLAVTNPGNLTLNSLTVRNGRCDGTCDISGGYGGNIYNSGTLVLDDVRVSGGSAVANGGGIFSIGILTIRNHSLIGGAGSGNSAGQWGGGLMVNGGPATIDASTISANSAVYGGGGVYSRSSSTITIQNDSLIGGVGAGNTAQSGGGLDISKMIVDNSTVSFNSASGSGGGIFNGENMILRNGSLVSGNTAGYGGGLANHGFGTIDASTIRDNSAQVDGGGILNGFRLTIRNGSVIGGESHGNTAEGKGGGLFAFESTLTVFENSTIQGNSADLGGGIYSIANDPDYLPPQLDITGSKLIDNQAATNGGAIFALTNIDQNVSITGSCIVANSGVSVMNAGSASQIATGNWWGAADGPTTPGSGDSVSGALDISGFLTSAPAGCPENAVSLSDGLVDFGSQPVNTTSTLRTVTLTNLSGVDVNITTLSINGQFALAGDTCTGVAVTPGATCTFEVTFTPPSSGSHQGGVSIASNAFGGPHHVVLSGTGSAAGLPPTLTAPKDGAAVYTSMPKLTWKAQKPIITYHIRLDNVTDPLAPFNIADRDVLKPTFSPGTLPYGTYAWQVRTLTSGGWSDYSPAFSFDVTLNKTPAKNGLVLTQTPKFTWQPVKKATYHIRIWDSNGCGDTLVWEDDAPKATYTQPATNPLPFGDYFWQVTPDGASYTPCWPFQVTLHKTPKQDQHFGTGEVRFSWQAIAGATYRLQVIDMTGTHRLDITTDQTSYKIPKDQALLSRLYYWHLSVDGGTTWTPYWTLYVETP